MRQYAMICYDILRYCTVQYSTYYSVTSMHIYIYTYIHTYYMYMYGPVLRLSTPPSPPHGLGPQVAAPLPFYLQAIGSISEVQLRIC